jgi:hypothetical protein
MQYQYHAAIKCFKRAILYLKNPGTNEVFTINYDIVKGYSFIKLVRITRKRRFTGADIYFEESLDSFDKVDIGW